MAVGRELFKLYGKIGMLGVEPMKKELTAIEKQARKVQREVDRMGKKVSAVGKVLTKAFTLPLLAAATASIKFIDDATDLNETISKTGEIFGSSAKEIERWASTSATKIGQSKTQAMDAAATFAIFGKSAGLAGEDLVKFSTEFTELASDMSSFFNTKPEEAITAIGAALRGENEPIRRYGVLLDDATMRAKAFELGLISSTKKALEPQTKVLAAQALILEQTSDAQGDFARTSEGLANKKRILAAQLTNISANLGQLFLPAALKAAKAVQRLIGLAERLIEGWKNLSTETKTTIKGFVAIAAALGPVVFAVGKMITFSKVLVPLLVSLKMGTFSLAGALTYLRGILAGPGGIIVVITALIALGWYWYSNWDRLSKQTAAVWAKIKSAFVTGANTIAIAVADAMVSVIDSFESVTKFIPGLAGKMREAKKELLLFQAAMYKGIAQSRVNANAKNVEVEAYLSLKDAVSKANEETKKSIDLDKAAVEEKNKLTQLEKEQAEATRQAAVDREAFNADIQDQLKRQGADKFELLELDRLKAVEEAEKKGADVLAVNYLYHAKYQELLAEAQEAQAQKDAEEVEAVKQQWQNKLNLASNLGNKINNVLNKFSDNRLRRIDIEEKKKIQAVKASGMTEEQKEAAIQKIQEDAEKKRQKAEKQRAIREKFAALFNIGINTAAAIVEALPNIPLSIAVGAIGLAEAAAVASAPLPFKEGGFIQGSEQGVNAVVGEKGTDELVFPLERGIGLLVDRFIEKIGEIGLPTFGGPELSPAGAGVGGTVNLNIGTFIGDQRGLKELERKLYDVRVAENQRKGF